MKLLERIKKTHYEGKACENTFEDKIKAGIIEKYGDFNLISANAAVEDVENELRRLWKSGVGETREAQAEAKTTLARLNIVKKFRHDFLLEAQRIRDGESAESS